MSRFKKAIFTTLLGASLAIGGFTFSKSQEIESAGCFGSYANANGEIVPCSPN